MAVKNDSPPSGFCVQVASHCVKVSASAGSYIMRAGACSFGFGVQPLCLLAGVRVFNTGAVSWRACPWGEAVVTLVAVLPFQA